MDGRSPSRADHPTGSVAPGTGNGATEIDFEAPIHELSLSRPGHHTILSCPVKDPARRQLPRMANIRHEECAAQLQPDSILTGNPICFDIAPGNRWNGPVAVTLHDDELRVDVRLVRALVDGAFPEYASLPLSPLGSSGSSNTLLRLGDEFLIRIPRQPGGSATIEKEARWLPQIGPLLPASRLSHFSRSGIPDY